MKINKYKSLQDFRSLTTAEGIRDDFFYEFTRVETAGEIFRENIYRLTNYIYYTYNSYWIYFDGQSLGLTEPMKIKKEVY